MVTPPASGAQALAFACSGTVRRSTFHAEWAEEVMFQSVLSDATVELDTSLMKPSITSELVLVERALHPFTARFRRIFETRGAGDMGACR